ncbi:response regulator transcription factor [Streptosporangium sp. NPDC048047]|uniref:response regulator transcription factor n=1 Tax=Streptosporangium sp. NPDC048047 TaxID=3155748 RepID=UPI003413C468
MTEAGRETGGAPVRVLVVDDQTVVREGLTLLLGLLPGIEVAGSAGDGEAALRLVRETRPDVVLMDLRMPRMDGVEATGRIRAAYPDVQVVVLTTYSDDESVFAALRAGARGFLTKSADAEEISRAVAAVTRGDAQLDPAVQRRLLDAMPPAPPTGPARRDLEDARPGSSRGHGGPPVPVRDRAAVPDPGRERAGRTGPARERDALPDGLTRREGEVLRLIAEGRSNAEIAAALFISEATVKTHVNNLFAKIGARDRAQAVGYAYRRGVAGT